MPAASSIYDTIGIALQRSFQTTKSKDDSMMALTTSSSRILQSQVEYEESEDFRTNTDHLKSKYLVLGLSNADNSDAKKVSENSTPRPKKESAKLGIPEPAVTLYPPNKVQLGWINNLPIGAGLYNLGNTCYLNSTLQALFHVPALVNWLLGDPHHESECDQNGRGGVECLTCTMAKTLRLSHKKSGEAMQPNSICNKLRSICRTMVLGQQEDAHEFLRYLLEGMEKAYLSRHKATKLDNYSKETTPINQIFGGYLRTEVKCLQCKHVSTTFQHFQDLLVDIRKASSLDEALANYFSQEQLDNDFKCEACKRRVPATKQFSLERPPKVLCVQLKRFSVLGGKIQRQITFKNNIDMGPYQWNEGGSPKKKLTYKLTSMVTHMGSSVNCGHYTAVAQVSSGKYYNFDDSCVNQINFNRFINTNAYIMMFEMESNSQSQPQPPKTNGVASSINCFSSLTTSPVVKRVALKPQSSPIPSKSNESTPPANKESQRFIGPLLPSSMKQHSMENGKTAKKSSLVPYEGSSDEEETSKETKPEDSTKSTTPAEKVEARASFPKENSKTSKSPNGNGVNRWEKPPTNGNSGSVAMTNGHSEPRPNGFHENRKPVDSEGKDRWKKLDHEEKITTKTNSSKSDFVASTTNGWSVTENKDEPRKNGNYNTTTNASAMRPFDGTNKSDTVDILLKRSHSGYGNSSVNSWDGNKSHLDQEVESEQRYQDRKRQFDDDDDIDRGRVKKIKTYHDKNYERSYKSNPFQDYQNRGNNYSNRYYNQNRYFHPNNRNQHKHFDNRNRHRNYRNNHRRSWR